MPIQQSLPRTRNLPTDTPAMPDPVKAAVASALEAGLAYETGLNERAAADAGIKQAEAADQAADRAAVAAGSSLSSKSAVPAAKDAAELAARRLAAAESSYRARFDELVACIVENRDEWVAAAEQERQGARDKMRTALQEFSRARAEHMAINGALETLQDFVPGFARPWSGFPSAQSVERRASGFDSVREDVLTMLRGRRRFTITEDQIDGLLVELEFLGAGEKPWGQVIRSGRPRRPGE